MEQAEDWQNGRRIPEVAVHWAKLKFFLQLCFNRSEHLGLQFYLPNFDWLTDFISFYELNWDRNKAQENKNALSCPMLKNFAQL